MPLTYFLSILGTNSVSFSKKLQPMDNVFIMYIEKKIEILGH